MQIRPNKEGHPHQQRGASAPTKRGIRTNKGVSAMTIGLIAVGILAVIGIVVLVALFSQGKF